MVQAMTPTLESWCTGVLTKRGPDGVHVCMDILKAGLRNGRASANDVRDLKFDEPNVIGGWFRGCAVKSGFRKADPYRDRPPYTVKSTKKTRHSGESAVWILEDSAKAHRILREFTAMMMPVTDDGQGVML